jgi:hypothetical protein
MMLDPTASDNGTAWAVDNKAIAQVDPNAGANAGSSQTGESQPGTSTGDMGKSDSANGSSGSPVSGAASDAGTNAAATSPSGTGDASLDSMWNETASPTTKRKSKKKGRTKSKGAKGNDNSGANAGSASQSDLAPSSSTSASSNAASTAPSASPTAASESVPVSVSSPSPSGSTNIPSDFGAYPAITSPVTPAANTTAVATPAAATTSLVTPAATIPAATKPAETTTPAATKSNLGQTTTTTTTTTDTGGTTSPSIKSPVDNNATTSTNASAVTNTINAPNTAFGAKRPDDGVRSAPLCATHSFFQSDLVRTVSWPGVGPFKGDSDPNDLADPQENKLTLQTIGDKLTSAELILMHQPGNPQGFINLQMVADFMLEALGARDKKINDFNGFLEKNKEKLAKKQATEEKPLTTTSGPYLISIASPKGMSDECSFLIQVKSKNASAEMLKSHSADNTPKPLDETIPISKGHESNTTIAVNIPPEKRNPDIAKTKPAKQSAAPKEVKAQNQETNTDQLKQEFVDTIRGWQTIKKAAVKNQETSELSKVLSGKALDKQTVAIGWLTKKKDYYELSPKGVTVDRYEELSQSPKRYAVYAQVKESSKLMDQTTGKQISESDDQYNVKYTIEKSGDHWSIYDSDLIRTTATPTGDQSKGKTKSKH